MNELRAKKNHSDMKKKYNQITPIISERVVT